MPTKNVIDTAFKDPIKRAEVQFVTCLSSRHIDGVCITVQSMTKIMDLSSL